MFDKYVQPPVLSQTVPFAAPHAAIEDFELGGYLVPKDSIVILHLHSVHHDPACWEAPEEFRPERWISKDGKLKKFDGFIPFSKGICHCYALSYTNAHMTFSQH